MKFHICCLFVNHTMLCYGSFDSYFFVEKTKKWWEKKKLKNDFFYTEFI